MSTEKSVLFQRKGVPSVGKLIPLSLQHVVAAVVGIITPSVIVANTCGLTADERTMLMAIVLNLILPRPPEDNVAIKAAEEASEALEEVEAVISAESGERHGTRFGSVGRSLVRSIA